MSGVVPGPIVPDTDLPTPEAEIDPRKRPCRMIARLRVVSYSGGDVGSNWRWIVSIDGNIWDSGPRILANGQTLAVGETVLDRLISGACGTLRLPVVAIRAVEHDSILSDVGDGTTATMIACRETPSTQRVLILVPVRERTIWKLSAWLRPKRAILLFVIDISAQCVVG